MASRCLGKLFVNLGYWLYSLFFLFVFLNVVLASFVFPRIKNQVRKRFFSPRDWVEIETWRESNPNVVVIFCSSAGEYEQALPVVKCLEQEYSYQVFFIFFSYSAVAFAQV